MSSRFSRVRVALVAAVGVAASLLTGVAGAAPVTYTFTGRVAEFSYAGASVAPQAGDYVSGSFVYDANYAGQYLGGPWPREAAILGWSFTASGLSYGLELMHPFVQIPLVSGNEFSFLDEQPAGSATAPFFDQSRFVFDFSSAAEGVLPMSSFVGGSFIFAGGDSGATAGAFFNGVIDSLHVVPEPAAFGLMILALGSVPFWRRRVKR